MIRLLNTDQIEEGASRGIEYQDTYLFAVKRDGEIYLYYNRCPHLGTPLEWEEHRFLDADGALIQCATHGALFQIKDGYCVAGPCKGKHLQSVPHRMEDGYLLVDPKYLRPPRTG